MSELFPTDALKTFAEDLMLDECIITRLAQEDADAVWDDTLGEYTYGRVTPDEVYRGKCMVYSKAVQASPAPEGGEEISKAQMYVSIPYDWEIQVKPEDEILITESLDPTMRGQKFYVVSAGQDTINAVRDLSVMREEDRIE